MQCDLRGQVALVTGGAQGIGNAIARRLAENGASIAIADIDADGAKAATDALPDAIALSADIRDAAAVDAAVEAIMARYGRIDILVNNAGVNTFRDRVEIDRFPVDEWHRIVGIDLDGTFLVSRAALQPMIASGRGGRIINIASVVGLAAMRLQPPFAAAKAAIVHLTRAMALELGDRGFAVNAIAPGSILTDGTRQLFYGEDGRFHDRMRAFMDHIPLARPGTPEEIAEAALFLASPASGYINGQVLTVDGGWTAGFMM